MPRNPGSLKALPPRIFPDEAHYIDLEVLNNFKKDILASKFTVKLRDDALRVVDCLRFIKTNMDFICYATLHRDDLRIYTNPDDREKKVVRDHKNTSIHIFYTDEETCRRELTETITAFENGILHCREKGKLNEFIYQLEYNDAIGCIDQRIARAMYYAANLMSTALPKLDDLMAKAAPSELQAHVDENYITNEVYKFFVRNGYLNTPCVNGNKDCIITKQLIDEYLVEKLTIVVDRDICLPVHQIEYDDVVRRIANHQCIIKGLRRDDDAWDFVLKQLADPVTQRPVRGGDLHVDRSVVYNPATGKSERRAVNPARGANKLTPYTKMTSTSLYPPHHRMRFFSDYQTALLFDIEHCYIKDKYVFPGNADTVKKWWLGSGDIHSTTSYRATSIKNIQKSQLSAVRILNHNEILARLSRKAALAIILDVSDLQTKLWAILQRAKIRKFLHLDVPVIIRIDKRDIVEYTRTQQLQDMRSYYRGKAGNPDLAAKLKEFDISLRHAYEVALKKAELECPVTLQIMLDPKMCMPCGHVFDANSIAAATLCPMCHDEILIKIEAPAIIQEMLAEAFRQHPELYADCPFSHDEFAKLVRSHLLGSDLGKRYVEMLRHVPAYLNEKSREKDTLGLTAAEILVRHLDGRDLLHLEKQLVEQISDPDLRFQLGDYSFSTAKQYLSKRAPGNLPCVALGIACAGSLFAAGYTLIQQEELREEPILDDFINTTLAWLKSYV